MLNDWPHSLPFKVLHCNLTLKSNRNLQKLNTFGQTQHVHVQDSEFNYTVYINVSAAALDHTFICNYISRRQHKQRAEKTVAQIIQPDDIEKCKNKAHTFLVNEDFKALSATQCLTFTMQRGLETKNHPDFTVKYIQIEHTKLQDLHFDEGESAFLLIIL